MILGRTSYKVRFAKGESFCASFLNHHHYGRLVQIHEHVFPKPARRAPLIEINRSTVWVQPGVFSLLSTVILLRDEDGVGRG